MVYANARCSYLFTLREGEREEEEEEEEPRRDRKPRCLPAPGRCVCGSSSGKWGKWREGGWVARAALIYPRAVDGRPRKFIGLAVTGAAVERPRDCFMCQ